MGSTAALKRVAESAEDVLVAVLDKPQKLFVVEEVALDLKPASR